MLTRNWYNQMRSTISKTLIPGGLTNLSGVVYDSGYYSNIYSWADFGYQVTVGQNPGIQIGSGTTPATIDDYKLEAPIALSGGSSTVVCSTDESGNPVRIYTITNGSSDSISINEIGWTCTSYFRNNTSSQTCLFDRTVLPQTVTIPAGGVGQIKYTITLPQIPE